MNYGFGTSNLKQLALKRGLSLRYSNLPRVVSTFVDRHYFRYNRIYKNKLEKHLSEMALQNSWKSLRRRQQLPVNGQRTHSNARSARRCMKK